MLDSFPPMSGDCSFCTRMMIIPTKRTKFIIMEATTGPLITHQRAVFSFVSQHLEEENSAFQKSLNIFSQYLEIISIIQYVKHEVAICRIRRLEGEGERLEEGLQWKQA